MARSEGIASMQARAAVNASWARTTDREARTRPAREAAARRFEREVDPDGSMDPVERAQRAEKLRLSFLARNAAKGGQARARQAAARAKKLAKIRTQIGDSVSEPIPGVPEDRRSDCAPARTDVRPA